jgi:hypothetical protein
MEKKTSAAFAALMVLLLACAGSGPGRSSSAAAPDSMRVRRDIEHLASDALEGRGTGTPGHDSASAFAARRYAALGLKSYAPGYFQTYTARSAMLAHNGGLNAVQTQNVVAYVAGTDPVLRNQVVVIGAHLDHLGRSAASALDPEARDAIRNGADDNASGSAAVLELARLISNRPLRRTTVFVNFSGEELGLLGSQYFVDHSPVPVDSIVAMLNFDMVGRMRDDDLMVLGAATSREWNAIIDSANARVGLRVRASGDGFGASDHSSFYAKNMPVLHFFTNTHTDYHRATDDADKVNAGGEAKIIALAEGIARTVGNRDARLSFVRSAAPAPVASGTGSNVYLGSIPDMGSPEIKGLKLTGVRAGSPADSGGIKAGDIIVEFGGKPVSDLQTYSDALYSYKPGDVVEVVVVRGTERLKLSVKLGRRGG